MADQLRVSKDNLACSFVLTELMADRGGGSVRENPLRSKNPLRSLYWELTQEKQMMATGLWQDTVYSMLLYGGQVQGSAPAPTWMRLHGGPISSTITLMQPTSGSLIFRMGSVCSPPRRRRRTPPRWLLASQSPLPGGPLAWGWRSWAFREHWLQIDPRALREWAMATTAIALGLRPTHPEERARTPQRTRVVDVILKNKTLPPGVVYVARGHRSHRLPVTNPATLRPVFLASTLCGAHHAALGR